MRVKRKNITDEFSFILKPSRHGIGVFVAHDIAEGTYLRLFGEKGELKDQTRLFSKEKIPELFRGYCVDRGALLICPLDFGYMPIGWYLNHSKKPNAKQRDYHWYASRDIFAGEEITIDYNTLEEPDEAKEDYYFF